MCRHLRPGYGHIEQLEMDLEPRCDDGTLLPDSYLNRWYKALLEATAQANKPIAYQHNTRQLLTQAGFTDIRQQTVRVPYHHWSRDPVQEDIGNFYQVSLNQIQGIEALCMAPFSRVFHWSKEQIDSFAEAVRADIGTTRIHAYNEM